MTADVPTNVAKTYFITTFYKFTKLKNLETIKTDLGNLAAQGNIMGLIILGAEGLNATVSSLSENDLVEFKKDLLTYFKMTEFMFKDSSSTVLPFRQFKIKIRKEIVTLGAPELIPPEGMNHHLTPREWNNVMKKEDDYAMIDTRNWYETKIGTFKGAVNPKTDQFSDFPQFMESQQISKDKKVLIFCTGGIRCEKGILELQRQGYKNVYQLHGGILNYIKEYPNDQFEGECFVFDQRVAVDQKLEPTVNYTLCPHCGQPAATKIDCKRCDTPMTICDDCAEIKWKQDTCSKNCAHQYELHPKRKAAAQIIVR
ncbi:MAG: hypothetical protein H7328_08080 [Bdellovibrio sp.]|nr:hypothetical protein [Bdellovibrio sp.]